MKLIFTIIAICLFAFVGIQIFAMKSQSDIESYRYKVIKTYDNFEIRSYEASLFSSVQLKPKSYDQASSNGFSILAGYIFGGNERNQKIDMTSPVIMTLEDTMTMMFMIPSEYDKSDLPRPNSSEITFQEEPTKIVAAITFGGWADDDKIEMHKEQLINGLKEENISYSDRFAFMGYNPPYEVTNRRNEVIVELIDYAAE